MFEDWEGKFRCKKRLAGAKRGEGVDCEDCCPHRHVRTCLFYNSSIGFVFFSSQPITKNLRNHSLNAQSDETKQFLIELLVKD